MENNNSSSIKLPSESEVQELLDFNTESGEIHLHQLLAMHGVAMPMSTLAFGVLYDMACKNQVVRMAYDDNTSYYEWSPIAIALMRPFMTVGLD